MSERTRAIIQWQQDLGSAPLIYYTTEFLDGQEEDTGHFYDSREAAEEEVEFGKRLKKRIKIRQSYIHSLDLSRRRWSGFTAGT